MDLSAGQDRVTCLVIPRWTIRLSDNEAEDAESAEGGRGSGMKVLWGGRRSSLVPCGVKTTFRL